MREIDEVTKVLYRICNIFATTYEIKRELNHRFFNRFSRFLYIKEEKNKNSTEKKTS